MLQKKSPLQRARLWVKGERAVTSPSLCSGYSTLHQQQMTYFSSRILFAILANSPLSPRPEDRCPLTLRSLWATPERGVAGGSSSSPHTRRIPPALPRGTMSKDTER